VRKFGRRSELIIGFTSFCTSSTFWGRDEWLSRKSEFEQITYAKETFAGKALAEAFKNSFSKPFSNSPILGMYVVNYSHPPFGAIGAIGKVGIELKELSLFIGLSWLELQSIQPIKTAELITMTKPFFQFPILYTL